MSKRSPLQKVNTRQRIRVTEAGEVSYGPVTMHLDPRGDAGFVLLLPDYVSKALGGPERILADTAAKADVAYEKTIRRYVDHVRTAFAEPVIILDVTVDKLIATISNAGRRLNELLSQEDVGAALLRASGPNMLLSPPPKEER